MGCVQNTPKPQRKQPTDKKSAPKVSAQPEPSDQLPVTIYKLESKGIYKDKQEPTLGGPYDSTDNPETKPSKQNQTTAHNKNKITARKQPARGQSVDNFCEELFKKHDQDNDGHLTLQQFRVILKELIVEDLSQREIREYRKSVDSNDNNRVELSQFKQLYKMLFKQ